jgi:hypothetical protein
MVALALADAQQAVQMRAAVVNRDLVGQAKGILMERHRITAGAAFALVAGVSQRQDVKLAEVAADLVETGELTGAPGLGQSPTAGNSRLVATARLFRLVRGRPGRQKVADRMVFVAVQESCHLAGRRPSASRPAGRRCRAAASLTTEIKDAPLLRRGADGIGQDRWMCIR